MCSQTVDCTRAQVLIPTCQFIRSLVAARLAADVCGVPTVLIARTDAHSANLLTADVDERDLPFVHGERTPEGFHQFNGGIKVRGVILVVGVYSWVGRQLIGGRMWRVTWSRSVRLHVGQGLSAPCMAISSGMCASSGIFGQLVAPGVPLEVNAFHLPNS